MRYGWNARLWANPHGDCYIGRAEVSKTSTLTHKYNNDHNLIITLYLIKMVVQIGLQSSVRKILAEEGARGLVLGWAPTLVGYSAQGLFKYGFYEVNSIVI